MLLLVLFACQANAQIYKSINADGEVVYSETPTKGAETVKMPALPTYTPPPVPASSYTPVQTPEKKDYYKTFAFVSPVNEETVRNNLGILNINAKLTPALQTRLGHRVQFYLNGEPYGKPAGKTSVTINNLDRGEYTLSAAVVAADGTALITTDAIVVYMKRHSILNPPFPSAGGGAAPGKR